ncbi:tRNA(Met) cytidine acetyltransferase TmcA [Phytobacter sp. V91]|uniref:tRNA(Met) cytidine acetyltransferase TmcA n=1 Tax=Phytobacter sp. V91 TaxID=3369425 RepID=UPI003F5F0BB8
MQHLNTLSAQMAREGIRRLLVIAGDEAWSGQQAQRLRETLLGDWLWVGETTEGLHCAPAALTTLLGREFTHAVLDARRGFDVAAFAALSGTLKPGSWLVLLTPPLHAWPQQPDADSVRWCDSAEPVPTPRFVDYFCRTLQQNDDALIWRQGDSLSLPVITSRPVWHAATGAPEREQAEILDDLLAMSAGVMTVTAPRGRGKSALAGMLVARLKGEAIVTAPSRGSVEVLERYAGEMTFMAPDRLLQRITDNPASLADWLIVDEAAAIPGPLLHALVSAFRKVLLTTTVEGYEGTGQGFMLKFCARFSPLTHRRLHTPLRWDAGCPLETFVSDLLLFDEKTVLATPTGTGCIQSLNQDDWLEDTRLPGALYRLLASAHYRTSPLDLRRMMDAAGQHFWVTKTTTDILAGLWLVEEGGLSPELSQAVWAGFRRPRGNLVAQSLAAHGGSPLAATLRGLRVSRIAVHPFRQREGLGLALIRHVHAHTTGCDYLSVSFGYTAELWRFWQRCGFQLVRLGSHREASSGCFTAMALLPLTAAGQALASHEQQRLARDLPGLDEWKTLRLPLAESSANSAINDDDWLELSGFAFAHRPLSASRGALMRVLQCSDLPLSGLRLTLIDKLADHEIASQLGLLGRKAVLAMLRQETASALVRLDGERATKMKEWVQQLQFF